MNFFLAAETLGFKSYAPAYLSPEASGKNLLIGSNFASAASGYDEKAAALNVRNFPDVLQYYKVLSSLIINLALQNAIPLSRQLEYFKEYQSKLAKVAGSKSASIIKGALYILSAGSSDFLQNYYVNPFVNKIYTADQYGSFLVGSFTSFVKVRYSCELFLYFHLIH